MYETLNNLFCRINVTQTFLSVSCVAQTGMSVLRFNKKL